MSLLDYIIRNDKELDSWDELCSYQKDSIVKHNNGVYQSKSNNNVGNDPTKSDNWILIL